MIKKRENMNLFKNKQSVLSRLSLSYLLVVLTGTILTGITANVILENSYDRQLVDYNGAVVNTLKGYIQKDIISGVDRAYLKLVEEESDEARFFVDAFYANDISYKNIKRAMNRMDDVVVPENEWLDGMYTYFPEAGVLVGTDGLIFKRGSGSGNMPSWMNTILESDGNFVYIPTMPFSGTYMYADDNICMIVKKYPFTSVKENVKGYIIFKINENVFTGILSQTEIPDEGEYRAIVDKNGNIIASTKEEKFPAFFPSATRLFKEHPEGSGYAEIKENGIKYAVTYQTIEPFDWRLMNVCPKNVFYKTSKYIQIGMFFVCILTILFGLAVSEHFKKKIYTPIKSIVDRIGGMSDGEKDEYGIIDAAINDMTYRLSDMQGMVDVARLAAKRELVASLCMDEASDLSSRRKMVQMCDFDTSKKAYISVIFRIDKDIIENLTVETVSGLVKNAIEAIDGITDENTFFVSGSYGRNKILAVAGLAHMSEEIISSYINRINELLYQAYYISCVTVVGTPVKRWEDIPASFESAKNSEKYTMFKKPGSIIYAPEALKLDNSSLMMDERIMENLRRDIYSFDAGAIKDDINNIIRELTEKGYSASYSNSKLLDIINIISAYLKSNGMNSSDIMSSDLITIFNEMDNIFEFEEWVYGIIERISDKLNVRNDTNNGQIIEKVKAYITDNISKELSLTSVSDRVYISSQYLCKIFKEETNMNFIDYVTQIRMEKAKELLLETNMNIESVAESVGYKTPHYFTKKFKERYGMTPKNFRMNQQ